MSGGIAPSKSTVYASNLPFSLTNNDMHKVFAKFGRVVKVTILKDKITRQSKGVAFVLFLNKEDAHKCCRSLNNTEMFGRIIKCSIAQDNGRATDFIRRKDYKDKSRCYECGDEGHLSYECPKNLLGDREPPEKRKRKRKYQEQYEDEYAGSESEEEEERKKETEDPALDSLAAAISYQQEKKDEEDYRHRVATGDYGPSTSTTGSAAAKKYKKDGYFSDEEELDS